MRKRFLVVLTLAVVVLIAALCAGNQFLQSTFAEPTTRPSSLVQYEATPVMAAPEDSQAIQPVFDAYKRFAIKFYQQCLTQDPGANIFISPLSVSTCLSMVYNGANGETRDAMARALELEGLNLEQLNTGTATLMASLTGDESKDSWFELSIANSLWAREGVEFRQDYMNRVTSAYSAKLTTLDFADPGTIPIINNWVKEQTRGKIEEIIDQIGPNDILLLLNSVYFKGRWQESFDKDETKAREFSLPGGTTKMHPMMRREGRFAYYKGPGFQSVSIPYGHGPLSMYVFLPDITFGLDNFHRSLTSENWDKWMSEYKSVRGELIMPRFKLRYEPDLDAALKALGMEIAFTMRADFSSMIDTSAFIGWTKHKTYVDVNESGTEAAAVTAVMMARSSIEIEPAKQFVMHVDRPFFVAIRDSRTGTILFMGAITDPKE